MQTSSTWQPIDTAPRDGTVFLAIRVVIPDEEQLKAISEGWMSLPKYPFPCRYDLETEEYDACFMALTEHGDEDGDCEPTHWMPLPNPPTEAV